MIIDSIIKSTKEACVSLDEGLEYGAKGRIVEGDGFVVAAIKGEGRIFDLSMCFTSDTVKGIYDFVGVIPFDEAISSGFVLFELLTHLIENEEETWIVDTDPLAWDVQAGFLRDVEDIEIDGMREAMEKQAISSEWIGYFNCSLIDWMS